MLFSKIVPNCKKLGLLDAGDGWLRQSSPRSASSSSRTGPTPARSTRCGRFSGYSLTPEGRHALAALLAQELDAAGLRGAVEVCYERFRDLNPELLEICTRWQLREVDGEPVINDHADAAHDAAAIEQLVDLHHRSEPLLADLADLLDRFARYGPALRGALARLQAGDLDAFTKPVVPSYHTVWFELHEDLLATLGIDRSAEVQPS
jgi:hypothetical protein